MDFIESIKKVKGNSYIMASLPEDVRNAALDAVATALENHKGSIFAANEKDLTAATESGLPAPIVNRLKFDSHKLEGCIAGIRDLINLEDPLFKVLLEVIATDGLYLYDFCGRSRFGF